MQLCVMHSSDYKKKKKENIKEIVVLYILLTTDPSGHNLHMHYTSIQVWVISLPTAESLLCTSSWF